VAREYAEGIVAQRSMEAREKMAAREEIVPRTYAEARVIEEVEEAEKVEENKASGTGEYVDMGTPINPLPKRFICTINQKKNKSWIRRVHYSQRRES
jgi:hypothetical protein